MDIKLCKAKFMKMSAHQNFLEWIKDQQINRDIFEHIKNEIIYDESTYVSNNYNYKFPMLCRSVERLRKQGYEIMNDETYPKPVSCKATCCDKVETYSIPGLQKPDFVIGYCANCHTITTYKVRKYSMALWDVEIITQD